MKKILTLIALMPVLHGFSQMTVTPVTSPDDVESAVNTVLLGEGVAVSNIIYVGQYEQIMTFSGADTGGLPSGIVLSSGNAGTIAGTPGNESFVMTPLNADLLSVANSVPDLLGQAFYVSSTYDEASLHFDFTPLGDNASFTFVFASDEYLEWVNTSFNDVFAFFVSGPGINGSFQNGAVNIAVVPGSSPEMPITISSVNNLVNSDYYIDNPTQVGLMADGYTLPLQAAITGLTAGETYHMQIAIADCSDMALNSYVMLGSGSFSSSVTAVGAEYSDFNSDGIINVEDLMILMSDFGCTASCQADTNGDGTVNVADVLNYIAAFGEIVN